MVMVITHECARLIQLSPPRSLALVLMVGVLVTDIFHEVF